MKKMKSLALAITLVFASLLGMAAPAVAQEKSLNFSAGQGPFDRSDAACKALLKKNNRVDCAALSQNPINGTYLTVEVVANHLNRDAQWLIELNKSVWGNSVQPDMLIPVDKLFSTGEDLEKS